MGKANVQKWRKENIAQANQRARVDPIEIEIERPERKVGNLQQLHQCQNRQQQIQPARSACQGAILGRKRG